MGMKQNYYPLSATSSSKIFDENKHKLKRSFIIPSSSSSSAIRTSKKNINDDTKSTTTASSISSNFNKFLNTIYNSFIPYSINISSSNTTTISSSAGMSNNVSDYNNSTY